MAGSIITALVGTVASRYFSSKSLAPAQTEVVKEEKTGASTQLSSWGVLPVTQSSGWKEKKVK